MRERILINNKSVELFKMVANKHMVRHVFIGYEFFSHDGHTQYDIFFDSIRSLARFSNELGFKSIKIEFKIVNVTGS